MPTLSAPGIMRAESVPLDEFLGNAAYHKVVLKTKTLPFEASSSLRLAATSAIGLALLAAHVNFSAINYADYLSGLKRTGGGIGNSSLISRGR